MTIKSQNESDSGAAPAPAPANPGGVTRSSQTRDPEFRIENTPYEKRLPSCAECRRLKRRCDRKWPCQSCIARGCASICPNGSLSTEGSGSRSILRKIKEMSKRIGQLEDALTAIWQGAEPHPLLKPDLLKIKSLPDTSANNEPEEEEKQAAKVKVEDETDSLAADLDTLTLGTNGKMNYMGRTAKYEFILTAEELDPTKSSTDYPSPGSDSSVPSPAPSLPQSITDLSHSFLLTAPLRNEVSLDELRHFLPSYHRAANLVDYFYANAGWFYSPSPKEDFNEDIVAQFYPHDYHATHRKGAENGNASTYVTRGKNSAHDLALLFLVLGFGMQLEAPYATHSEDSEVYQTLSRAALALEPVTNGCSISLIQIIELMVYRSHFDHNNAQQEFLWGMMGLATKFAQTLGLHRDCAKWDSLTPKEINTRRYVFWELFSCNVWTALGSGRPPAMELIHTDCQLPNDPAERISHSGKVTNRSFYNNKHIFTRDCLWPVIEQNFNLSKTYTYSEILAIDRKIREFDFGNIERDSLKGNGKHPNPNIGLLMQRFINKNCKDHVILHMHRLFFARALSTHPDSPVDSPYGSSVLATFASAVSLIQDVEVVYEQVPPECIPIGVSWAYVLTSGMTMGMLCTKGPKCSYAPYAFARMQSAVELSQRLWGRSQRTVKHLPMLQNLLASSARAISSVGPGPTSTLEPLSLQLVGSSPRSDSSGASRSRASPPSAEDISQTQDATIQLPPFNTPTASTSASASWQYNPSIGLPTQTVETNDFRPQHLDTYASSSVPVPIHGTILSLPQESESDYRSLTFQHQATNSFKPMGMPILADDYTWSEPESSRPLKRIRYADPIQEIVIPSSTPVYQNGGAGGEMSPVSAQVQTPQFNWFGQGHASSSGTQPIPNHLQRPQPPVEVNVYQDPAQSHPQWMHPPSLSLSLPTPTQHQPFEISHSAGGSHGYSYYETEQQQQQQISPAREAPAVNMTGSYNVNSIPSWQAYPSSNTNLGQ